MDATHSELPLMAAVNHPSTHHVVFVVRGRSGYFEPAEGTETELPACADEWNQQNGISCEQAHALLMGSMFGCDESGEWPDWAAAAAFKIPQGHCQCVQPAQGPIGGIN
ncbi:MAG: hypothetical protein ACO3KY_10670, partial [Lysobacterales bacterium]